MRYAVFIKTIFFFALFGMILAFSFLVFIPLIGLKKVKLNNCFNAFLLKIMQFWGRTTIYSTGSKVSVFGIENIPLDENVGFVGNHQSNMDIPLMLGFTPVKIGFLAKKELDKTLIIRQWMRIIGCVFVDRENMRDTLKAAMKTIKKIKEEQSMVLFPEGTRSKSQEMKSFKEGTIRFLINENITIVPFTIVNTYQLFEENKKIHKADIELHFHKPVQTHKITLDQFKDFVVEIRSIINEPLLSS